MAPSIICKPSNHTASYVFKLFVANTLCALLLTACTSDTSFIPVPFVEPPPIVPSQEDTARFVLLRAARWPGGGRELTVGVVNQATGRAFPQDLSSRLVARPPADVTITTKVTRIFLATGYTAVLLPPQQTAMERADLAQAVVAFAAQRPASERIALYRHGDSVQIFSNFLQDRNMLTEALNRYQKGVDSDANPLPLLQAIGPVANEVHSVGGDGPDVMRSLVVLAKDPSSVFLDYSQAFVIAVTPDAAGLAIAANAMDDARQNGFYKLASCGSEAKFSAGLHITGMQGDLSAGFPVTLPEEIGATCNVDSIDSAKRVFTPRIELVFDATQRAAHAARILATQSATYNDALARSDFETQVRLAPGQPTVLATAHLHGNGSLRCARKSYTVQLTGSDRYLMPDSAADEYTLISMCDDPAYVYAPTVFDLLGGDLFPVRSRFVEFVIDGQTKGIYILLEKVREELVRDHARATSVMRRQYPQGTNEAFEVLYSDNDDLLAPKNRYTAFAAQIAPLTGDTLIAELRNHLDLDQYLRFLAGQSVLKSGDYIDEVYYVGAEQANGLGATNETYRVMVWDPEGYTNCHSGGANAYVDTNNMAYCAEARLDFKILADAKVYALFVNKVEATMNGSLSREKMAAALDRTKTALQALLSTPATCAAMTELLSYNAGAADCTVARNVIAARADAILAAYDARRAYLVTQLAGYRARN